MIVTEIYCDVGNAFATHMPLFTGNIFKGQTEQPRPGKDTSNPSTVYRNAGTGKAEGLNSIINDIRPPGDKVSSDTTYRIVGNGEKEAFIPPSKSTTARDTSYRNKGALTREYLGSPTKSDPDKISSQMQQSSSTSRTNDNDEQTGRSNTTYRNAGAGKVETVASSKQKGGKPRREMRKAASFVEHGEIENEFASGLDTRWVRTLLLDNDSDVVSSEIIGSFCGTNTELRQGDGIVRIRDERKNGEMVWYDVYYNGDAPIRILSTCWENSASEIIKLNAKRELCKAYFIDKDVAHIPTEGEYGFIRMPFVDDEMQIVSRVTWKAPVSSVLAKGDRMCELGLIDNNCDPLSQYIIYAPCRLQVSSDDFDSTTTVYTDGILLEYVRLPEVVDIQGNPQRNTLYRNHGKGRKEEITDDTICHDTTYRNSGAGKVEVTRFSNRDPQSHAEASNSNRRSNQQPIAKNSKPPTNKRFTFKTSVSYFAHGMLTHWTKKTGSKFLKGDVICHVACCTTSNGVPCTEIIKAPIDLVIKEKFITVNDRIEKGTPLFRYQALVEVTQREKDALEKSTSSKKTSAPTSNQSQSVQSNIGSIFSASPIEYLDEIIELVSNGHSFQFRNVLETIITTERERINDERAFWKLGAGVVTLVSGGLIDGFGMSDLFFSLGMSNVAGMAHQLASKEQVEFLKKMQSEWLVLERSPIDIRRRLGEPQGRFIGMSRDNICDAFNIHHSGSRGFHLVDLDFTSNAAEGFNDSQFREVLQRSFDEEDIESLATQLYPSTVTPLRMCRTITPEEARKKDPYYPQLSKVGAPFRVVYSDDTEGIMYKIQIPHHSDY